MLCATRAGSSVRRYRATSRSSAPVSYCATAGCDSSRSFAKTQLTSIIQNFSKGGQCIDAGDSELMPLVSSINELVTFADTSVTDGGDEAQGDGDPAQGRHRRASGSGGHPLHHISDAVLVTDVFDELVLANDAACAHV